MVNFNISNEDRQSADAQNYDALPEGVYPAMLEKVVTKTSQAGNDYVAVTLGVIDGTFKGRKYFENLNLFHPEEKTRKIAVGKLRLFEKALDTIIGSEEEFAKYVGTMLTFELETSKKTGNTYLKAITKGSSSSNKPTIGLIKPSVVNATSDMPDDAIPF